MGTIGESAEDLVMKARCRLLVMAPWYGTMASLMEWTQNEEVRTMGVRMKNGGRVECMWSAKFVEAVGEVEPLMSVIQHEIEHIVRMHIVRHGARDPQMSNVATDMCFRPDELMLGDNKPISMLSNGDKVFDGEGNLTKVVTPMTRHFNGELVSITARGMLPVVATPEHPILASRWHLVTPNKPGKTTKKYYGSLEFTNAEVIIHKPGYRGLGGKKAKVNRFGYALAIPRLKAGKRVKVLDLKPFIKSLTDGSIRTKKLTLNEDMAWLMGLYVAEGSAATIIDGHSGSMQFSLGLDEQKFADRIKSILGEYGYAASATNDDHSLKVLVCSPILGRAFEEWFGRGAKNKQIPDWLMIHPDQKIIAALLRGWFDGDGCHTKRGELVGGSVSKTLMLQLQLVAARYGFLIHLGESNRPEREIDGVKLPPEQIWTGTCREPEFIKMLGYTPINKTKKRFHETLDDYLLCPVRKVDTVKYSGDVCNVETKSHTYLVSSAVVHNCVNGTESRPHIDGLPMIPVFDKDGKRLGEAPPFYFPEGEKDLSTDSAYEEVYDWLDKKSEKIFIEMEGGKGPDLHSDAQKQPKKGQKVIKGTTVDDHSVWDKSEVGEDEARQAVKDMVDQATKKAGTAPGHLVDAIKELQDPKVNWKYILKQFCGRCLGGKRKTYARRNRRWDLFGIPGKSNHSTVPLLIGVDVSGSVAGSPRMLEQFFTEIEQMSHQFKITLALWDAKVQMPATRYHRGDWRKIKAYGGSGTNPIFFFEYLKEQHLLHNVIIILTDGEFSEWPEQVNTPTLWAIATNKPGSVKVPWGQVVEVELK